MLAWVYMFGTQIRFLIGKRLETTARPLAGLPAEDPMPRRRFASGAERRPRLCSFCGDPLSQRDVANTTGVCSFHGASEAGEKWAKANKVACDFFHRGVEPPVVPSDIWHRLLGVSMQSDDGFMQPLMVAGTGDTPDETPF